MKWKWSYALILAGVIGALSICAMFWSPTRSDTPIDVRMSFAGFTNDLKGLPLAVFQVTNAGEVSINFGGFYDVELRDDAGPKDDFYSDTYFSLAPGTSRVFSLAAFTNGGPWRVRFYCSRDRMRETLAGWAAHLPNSVYRFLPDAYQGIPVEEVRSDWIGL